MSRLFAMYDRALTAQPILTKTLTSVVLFTAGDVMAQRLEKGSFAGLDGARLVRQGAWGALFTPLAHYWYLNLDRWVPGAGMNVVAKKVVLDQLTWTPFINVVFLGTVRGTRLNRAHTAALRPAAATPPRACRGRTRCRSYIFLFERKSHGARARTFPPS